MEIKVSEVKYEYKEDPYSMSNALRDVVVFAIIIIILVSSGFL